MKEESTRKCLSREEMPAAESNSIEQTGEVPSGAAS